MPDICQRKYSIVETVVIAMNKDYDFAIACSTHLIADFGLKFCAFGIVRLLLRREAPESS